MDNDLMARRLRPPSPAPTSSSHSLAPNDDAAGVNQPVPTFEGWSVPVPHPTAREDVPWDRPGEDSWPPPQGSAPWAAAEEEAPWSASAEPAPWAAAEEEAPWSAAAEPAPWSAAAQAAPWAAAEEPAEQMTSDDPAAASDEAAEPAHQPEQAAGMWSTSAPVLDAAPWDVPASDEDEAEAQEHHGASRDVPQDEAPEPATAAESIPTAAPSEAVDADQSGSSDDFGWDGWDAFQTIDDRPPDMLAAFEDTEPTQAASPAAASATSAQPTAAADTDDAVADAGVDPYDAFAPVVDDVSQTSLASTWPAWNGHADDVDRPGSDEPPSAAPESEADAAVPRGQLSLDTTPLAGTFDEPEPEAVPEAEPGTESGVETRVVEWPDETAWVSGRAYEDEPEPEPEAADETEADAEPHAADEPEADASESVAPEAEQDDDPAAELADEVAPAPQSGIVSAHVTEYQAPTRPGAPANVVLRIELAIVDDANRRDTPDAVRLVLSPESEGDQDDASTVPSRPASESDSSGGPESRELTRSTAWPPSDDEAWQEPQSGQVGDRRPDADWQVPTLGQQPAVGQQPPAGQMARPGSAPSSASPSPAWAMTYSDAVPAFAEPARDPFSGLPSASFAPAAPASVPSMPVAPQTEQPADQSDLWFLASEPQQSTADEPQLEPDRRSTVITAVLTVFFAVVVVVLALVFIQVLTSLLG